MKRRRGLHDHERYWCARCSACIDRPSDHTRETGHKGPFQVVVKSTRYRHSTDDLRYGIWRDGADAV